MIRRAFEALPFSVASILLSACVATGPFPGVPIISGSTLPPRYAGPVAAPQVVYRIDQNRYFEVVPDRAAACDAPVYYVDQAQGIRSYVMGAKSRGGNDLIIDAANTQYLVAPIIKGGGSCYTCGGSWLPYSVDGGRTWSHAISYGGGVQMSGGRVYTGGASAKVADLVRIKKTSDLEVNRDVWTKGLRDNFPKPIKAPLDTKFHCVPNGKE